MSKTGDIRAFFLGQYSLLFQNFLIIVADPVKAGDTELIRRVGFVHRSSSGVSATMKLERGSRFAGGGGVSLFWAFRLSRCRLASVRYLVRVWGFTSIPFSCSFSTISCVSKPRFFIRSSVGARVKMAVLHGHGAVSVQRDGGGLEPGELLSDLLHLAGCDVHGGFSCD